MIQGKTKVITWTTNMLQNHFGHSGFEPELMACFVFLNMYTEWATHERNTK
jgi:hypothetical protein